MIFKISKGKPIENNLENFSNFFIILQSSKEEFPTVHPPPPEERTRINKFPRRKIRSRTASTTSTRGAHLQIASSREDPRICTDLAGKFVNVAMEGGSSLYNKLMREREVLHWVSH